MTDLPIPSPEAIEAAVEAIEREQARMDANGAMNDLIRSAAGRNEETSEPEGEEAEAAPADSGTPVDEMNAAIRAGARGLPRAVGSREEEEPLPAGSFDHGARASIPPPGPNPNEELRALWRAGRRAKHVDYWPEDADPTR